MAEREIITSRESVYHGPIFNVEKQQVKLYSGEQSQRDVVRHVPAVAIIALTDDDCIILEKQYRATIEDFTLEIPAGKLDERDFDSPQHAVLRELNEELRMTSNDIKQVASFYQTVGFSDAYMYLYIARELKNIDKSEQLPRDLGESIDLVTLSFEDMKFLFDNGKLTDQKTMTAFLYWSYIRG